MDLEDLLDAWRVNNMVNLELLALCGDEDLELKPGKGKTIRSNYVHLIGVRRAWAEEKLRKEASVVPRLDWKSATQEEIEAGLAETSSLMEQLFSLMASNVKPGRWKLLRFFAYCIAHEAHHRSQIEIALRINNREPEVA